ncbi:hypothetical protein BXQ17_13960 [Polaribacter sp. BM10]|uniref:glycosyltransferase n=1 Tax=Polaribacter sp. BM10 TaxID=1529069 RepID=UPI00098B8944|nr:glycosyltransferase [Polaribacter sp. BM10]AQS95113.1 hypothetical protein BXQ17_13960 [Polaribacter sp. BM10]
MKKIGIIELCEKNHHSMIYNWISIANVNNWDITLFTTESIYENVKDELRLLNYNLVLKDRSSFFFFKKIKNHYKEFKLDSLIFLSITRGFFSLLFLRFKKINLGITIHNSNAWFLGGKPKKIRHLPKIYVRSTLKKDANFFIVNSSNMKNYIDLNFIETKPIHILPFSLRRTKVKKVFENQFTTVYPGSVNVNRKNYDSFITLAKENPEDKFILLGSYVNDKKSIDVFNKMKEIRNIKVFEDYVPLKDFHNILGNCNLLFSDIAVNFELAEMREVYGLTKDSGISYSMIEYSKPLLVNKSFKNLLELDDCTLYFQNKENLLNLYKRLRDDSSTLISIQNRIKNNTKQYSVEHYAKSLRNL